MALTEELLLQQAAIDFGQDEEIKKKSILHAAELFIVYCKGVKSETARIHHQQEWIPTSERLPEERGRYLCWVETINDLGKESYVWNCYYGGQDYLFADNGIKYNVTHWTALPPAPTINKDM